ncbi:restriction endonuclease subunit S [Specibacter sp. NPDC078692]|uniref:restriction endonuclease subunit S n=1 Tax=Specibacter sp. NPDC078692 TaxID=3155818 RepID=UPI003435848E
MHNSVRELRIRDLIDSLTAGVSVRSVDSQHTRPAVLKTSAISKGRFDPTEAKTILSADIYRARCNPKRDSILVSRMNTPALVGEVGYVDRDFDELFLPDRLWQARSRPGVKVDMRWLTYYLSSDIGSMAIRDLASGTSGSMKNIPKAAFLDLSVSTPTLKEQQKISIMLGDVDSLIASLERLIAKKQAIKQGMMQQLLTGRTRLSGFSEPWREVRLGDLGATYGGLTGKSGADFGSGKSRFITFMDVMSNIRVDGSRAAVVNIGASEKQNAVRTGDLLFNGSSETPEELALCSVVFSVPLKTYLNSFCFGFRPRSSETVDAEFIAYVFRGSPGRKAMMALAQGATRYNLAKSQFRELSFELPEAGEQRAIARCLRDVDIEIDAMKKKLNQTRSIKKGMMQELLTGRTRLHVKESAV